MESNRQGLKPKTKNEKPKTQTKKAKIFKFLICVFNIWFLIFNFERSEYDSAKNNVKSC